MPKVVPTALAAVALVLFATALFAMYRGEPMFAGFSFLSASVVIYLRETRADRPSRG